MPDTDGPWKRRDEPSPGPSRLRVAIWLGLLALGAFGLWELARLFPDSRSDDWQNAWLIRYVAFLVIASTAILRIGRLHVRETIRNAALWSAIFAVLVVGYTFRDDLQAMLVRVQSALIPGYVAPVNASEMILSESDSGNYFVYGTVNGTPVKFLIDTGASDIVLSPADAKLAGIDTSKLIYSRVYETANGIGRGAPALASNITVGPMSLDDEEVSVNQAPMDSSLLGMAFLRHLKSYTVRSHRLYLSWR